MRRSFPAVYLKILRAPIRQTVAFAEDPSYRGYVSFFLTGIAIYCLLIVPIVMSIVAPARHVHVSESMLTLMKVLSQVGVYVGMAITFALAYALFRLFRHREAAIGRAYFKLYCLALGFVAPDLWRLRVRRARHARRHRHVVIRRADDATPIGSRRRQWPRWRWCCRCVVYFIAIHRRFWDMPVWKATALYLVAAVVCQSGRLLADVVRRLLFGESAHRTPAS